MWRPRTWRPYKFYDHGRMQHTHPICQFVGRGGQGGLPPIGGERRRGSGVAPFTQQNMQRNMAQMYSNITKRYANWNVCFSCSLMSKMDIRPKHALPPGDMLIIRRDTTGIIEGSALRRGMTRAPKQCTRVSCPLCDGVGQSR